MGTAPVETARTLDERYSAPARAMLDLRGRVRTVVGWLGVSVVFALVLELTCRVEDWVTYGTPLFSQYTAINDLVVRDADGMHGRPNARYQKWVMNGLGLRGPVATVVPPNGTLRVITVGASETFGLRESPGREYPRQLEDSLNARVARGACTAPAPIRFEVLNAAFAGMALPTIDQDLRNRLKRYRPDIVVIYPTPAQYLDEKQPYAAEPDSSGRVEEPSFLETLRPRVFDRLREQIKLVLPEYVKSRMREMQTRSLIRGHAEGWRFTTLPIERLMQYENDLRHLIGTIRLQGATPVLATHGNMFMGRRNPDSYALVGWEKFYPRATGKTIVAFDSAARVVTLRVGADSGVVTVDAAERLAGAPVEAFGDFVHFTDLGAGHMADLVADGVLAAEPARCNPSGFGHSVVPRIRR